MSKTVEIQQRKDGGKSFILWNLSVMLHGCESMRDEINWSDPNRAET